MLCSLFAKRIFSIYRQENSKFLIPYFRMDGIPKHKEKTEIALRITTCNKYLKRIGGLCELPIPLTSYVARYTWANVAKTLVFPKDQIAEALGHELGTGLLGFIWTTMGVKLLIK